MLPSSSPQDDTFGGGKHSFRLLLHNPDGKEVSRVEGYIDIVQLDERTGTALLAIPQADLPFATFGLYTLVFILDDQQISSLPLFINKRNDHWGKTIANVNPSD
ncbi:MAG: hypothetical protein NTZ35_10490 [Ignavibacteriales bacterium]|nr:hypothetical protein [Ignavibacteriales bacterium]